MVVMGVQDDAPPPLPLTRRQLVSFDFHKLVPGGNHIAGPVGSRLAYQLSVVLAALAGLVTVATVGNVLGAIVNTRDSDPSPGQTVVSNQGTLLRTAERHYRKYGRLSLLLSWVPFIGDPITVVAGVLREPLWSFVLLVSVAKGSRYVFVAVMMSNVT